MTAFLATLYDLRWVLAVVALIGVGAWLYSRADSIEESVAKALDEAAAEFDDDPPLDRLLAIVQSPEPLPAIDATEDEFAAYVSRAMKNAKEAS